MEISGHLKFESASKPELFIVKLLFFPLLKNVVLLLFIKIHFLINEFFECL
jgi:hypothetical protein